MVNHNISPETVLCGCCRDSKLRVPSPDITFVRSGWADTKGAETTYREAHAYKKRIAQFPERAEEYEKKQNLLKCCLSQASDTWDITSAIREDRVPRIDNCIRRKYCCRRSTWLRRWDLRFFTDSGQPVGEGQGSGRTLAGAQVNVSGYRLTQGNIQVDSVPAE